MARLRRRARAGRRTTESERERYEVCEVVRTRGGARVVRILATADSEEGARLAGRTIAAEEEPDVGPIWILDTATRLWLFRDGP